MIRKINKRGERKLASFTYPQVIYNMVDLYRLFLITSSISPYSFASTAVR